MKEDWLKNENNQMEFLIDMRAKAKDDFPKPRWILKRNKFLGGCKLFVVNLLLKLQERVPIQYALVRNSSSINPNNMTIQAAPHVKKVCTFSRSTIFF